MKKFLSFAIVSITLAAGAATSFAQSRPTELPPAPQPPAGVEARPENIDRPGSIGRERMRAAREKEAARTDEARPERRRERGAEAGPDDPPTPPTPQRREMIERRVERLDADGPARQRGGDSQNDDRRRDIERRIEQLRGELAELRKDRAEDDRRAPRADRDEAARRLDDRGDAPGKERHKARARQMRGESARGPGAQGGPSREQLMRFWRRYHMQQHFQAGPGARGFGRGQQGPGARAPMGQMGGFGRQDFQRQGPGSFNQRGPGGQGGWRGPEGADGPRGPQMNEDAPPPRQRRSHRDAN